MSGFKTRVSSNLRTIRNLLDEYTLGEGGITIIKELTQNADDAGASKLLFTLYEGGDPAADNPLLHGPALLVSNNGGLREEHTTNFNDLSGTSKAADESAVGKFGLGLKSVFHLCDAWLWTGMTDDGEAIHGVIDPYADPQRDVDDEKPGWNTLSDKDVATMRKAARAEARGGAWLALWLPLRWLTEKDETGGLTKRFFREQHAPFSQRDWPPVELRAQLEDLSPLVDLMPQLRHVRQIAFEVATEPGGQRQGVSKVEVAKTAERLGRFGQGAPAGEWNKQGVVRVASPAAEHRFRYWIAESVSSDPRLSGLVGDPAWPTVSNDVLKDGVWSTRRVKDKAVRHGAVTVVRVEPEEGVRAASWPDEGLSLGWAVYLPMGNPERSGSYAPWAWMVRLHGACFPDHARRNPKGFSRPMAAGELVAATWSGLRLRARAERRAGEPGEGHADTSPTDRIQAEWNHTLLEAATLPLLLPTMAQALAESSDSSEAEGVVRALSMQSVVRNARDVVTLNGQLVVALSGQHQRAVVKLVDRARRVVALPRVEFGSVAWTDLVGPVARHVEKLPEPPVLTWYQAPAVLASEGFAEPNDAELGILLGPAAIGSLQQTGSTVEKVDWMARLLESVASRASTRASREAKVLVAGVLARHGTKALRYEATSELWLKIVGLIPGRERLGSKAYQAIDRLPDQTDWSVLVLPAECVPDDGVSKQPERSWRGKDWVEAFQALNDAVVGPEGLAESVQNAVGTLAAQMIGSIGRKHVLANPMVRTLKLFSARSCRRNGKVLVSAEELSAGSAVFRKGPGSMYNQERVCDRLFDAVNGVEHDVLLLSDATLGDHLGVEALTEVGVLRLFQATTSRPEAWHLRADVGGRASLLEVLMTTRADALVGEDGSEGRLIRRGLRRILARVNAAEGDLALFAVPSSLDLRDEAIRGVLDLAGEGWRLVPQAMSELINGTWRRHLTIRDLTPRELLEKLQDPAPEKLDALCRQLGGADDRRCAEAKLSGSPEVPPSDLEALLLLAKDEPETWRQIPAHRTRAGIRVAATDPRLVRSTATIRTGSLLAQGVVALVEAEDERVAALQRKRIPEWGPSKAIEVGLHMVTAAADEASELEPELVPGLAVEILDAIQQLSAEEFEALVQASGTVGPEGAPSSIAWVPRSDGLMVAPTDILALPDSVACVARTLLHEHEDAFVLSSELHPAVQRHEAIARVLRLGSTSPDEALDALAMRLSDNSGDLSPFLVGPDRGELPPVREVMQCRESFSADAGWTLIIEAVEMASGGEEPAYPEDLVDVLCGDLSASRLAGILTSLEPAESRLDPDQPAAQVHRHMVGWLADGGPLSGLRVSVLREIRLPNALGHWIPGTRLTRIENARPDFRLHSMWMAVLGFESASLSESRQSTTLTGESPDRHVHTAKADLENYFRTWQGLVQQRALGLFVSLLGDGERSDSGPGELVELGNAWLGAAGTVSTLRYQAALHAKRSLSIANDLTLRHTETARVAVRVVQDGTEVMTVNLVGEDLSVPVGGNAEIASMLVGGLAVKTEPQWLLLAELDPAAVGKEALGRLLRDASHQVFLQLTGYRPGPGLDQLWDEFDKGGQVDVEVTRRLIRRELPSQLRLMGISGQETVARRLQLAVKGCRHAEQQIVELDLRMEASPDDVKHLQHRHDAATTTHREALRALEQLIEEPAAHQFLLGRVRARLREEQYDRERVPFELLQNADDAVAQLAEMLTADGRALPDEARRFRIELASSEKGELLRFWHWGRGINRHYVGPGFGRGRELGYHNDLRNMMLLHASDKSAQQQATGRFGLGFKSAHLVSERVRVQSETLAFDVRGGFLPMEVTPNGNWASETASGHQPTVVQLNVSAHKASEVLAAFLSVAPVVPMFTQALRSVELVLDGARSVYAWSPTPLPTPSAGPQVSVGEAGAEGHEGSATSVLVVRAESEAGPPLTFVVPVEGGQMTEMDPKVPTIWSTAPTSLRWRTGWAASGPFQVDVGRSQLGRTAHHAQANRRVALQLGRSVAEALGAIDCFANTDWEACARLLGMPEARGPTACMEAFWRSAWERLGSGLARGSADEVERDVLRAFGRGWFGFFAHERRIPTRLSGLWTGLTSMSDIHHVADSALARKDVANVVSLWPWVVAKHRQGSVVHPDVGRLLQRFRDGWRANVLDLETLVAGAWHGGPAPLEWIAFLHPVVGWLNDDEEPLDDAVVKGVRERLARGLFPTRAGSSGTVQQLLSPELDNELRDAVRKVGGTRSADDLELLRDEHLLVAFAPEERVLASEVCRSAEAIVVYMEARRGSRGASPDEVAEWARAARGWEAQHGVLRYLALSERGKALGKRLSEELPDWAASREMLESSGLRADLDDGAWAQVLAALYPRAVVAAPTPAPSPRAVPPLRKVADWWRHSHREYLDAVHREEWPDEWHDDGRLRSALSRERMDRDAVDAWMTFLLLGALRSLGRTTPSANRGFIQSLKEHGAWKVFLEDPREHGDLWTGALREWEDRARERPKYQRWWMYFPVAHQLRGHLDVYARVLRRVGREQWGEQPLHVRLTPRLAEQYTGAGRQFDAPWLPAGLGRHWLVRELSRMRLFGLPGSASRLGWVPDRQLRRVFESLGAGVSSSAAHHEASQRFSAFVERAGVEDWTFGGAYGIPLRVLAREPDLQQQVGLSTPLAEPSSSDDEGNLWEMDE